MALRAFTLAMGSLVVPSLGKYNFCSDGLTKPNFTDDGGRPSVDVIVVQAPLFSSNPKIGNTFGVFGWYHSAIVLHQVHEGTEEYWTLEFDATADGNAITAATPTVGKDGRMYWDADARWCLTNGLYWGREHWNKTYDAVMRLSATEVLRAFDNGVALTNSSVPGARPQYQLFSVMHTGEGSRTRDPSHDELFIPKMTCGDGVSMFLYWALTLNNASIRSDFRLHDTKVTFNADAIEPVDLSDKAEMDLVTAKYKHLRAMSTNESMLDRVTDFFDLLPLSYMYNTNTRTYFRIRGNLLPHFWFHFGEIRLCSPMWLPDRTCHEYASVNNAALLV